MQKKNRILFSFGMRIKCSSFEVDNTNSPTYLTKEGCV